MDKGQKSCHYSQGEEHPVLLIQRCPAQKQQAGEKYAPAKEGGPLGDEHVGNNVYPAYVFAYKVGGGLVKGGEYAGEIIGIGGYAVHEVRKAEAAPKEEQHKGQHGLFIIPEPVLKEEVNTRHNREKGGYHGQHVGEAQGCAKGVKGGAYAVAQEGIAHCLSGQYGILRREKALAGYAGDDAKMHAHIPIGGLTGGQAAVFIWGQHMGEQQHTQQQNRGHYAPQIGL